MTEIESPRSPTTPRMFPSQIVFDEIQLCFNKAHFAQNDFNVERFMNLARRRASLEEIHKDLRIYLKSIQNSMIELINDDYADFVHLSSNLVALKENIDKIETDLNTTWEEFLSTTKPFMEQAEYVESKSMELTRNRSDQARIRDELTFLRAVETMSHHLMKIPSPVDMVWLDQFSSAVIDAATFKGSLIANSNEEIAYNKVMARSHAVLADQAINSLKSDCQLLPMLLSVLSLCGCIDQLVAKIVSVVLAPKVFSVKGKPLELLNHALEVIKQVRKEWSSKLGDLWSEHVETFLDQTLLTFLITYLDEHLVTVLCPTVASDAKHFHSCFLLIAEFVMNWPTVSKQNVLLKQLKSKFQLPLYFKITTSSLSKQVDEVIDPANFALLSKEEKDSFEEDGPLSCKASATLLRLIKSVWLEEIFLLPLTDKFWEFTLRNISKYYAWSRAMHDLMMSMKDNQYLENPKWLIIFWIRQDILQMDQHIFNVALENIWNKIRELGVDTAPFGQYLSRESQSIKNYSIQLNTYIHTLMLDTLKKEIDGVADIPRQYRWTKKALPTKHSAYIDAFRTLVDDFLARTRSDPEFSSTMNAVLISASDYFVEKANQVMQTVLVTGSSISKYKRREGANQIEGDSDESKIRQQIVLDAEEWSRIVAEKELEVPAIIELIAKIRPPLKEVN